jgi:adenine-specific DNA-methyltransferase
MQKIEATSPEAQSADITTENIAKLRALFPEVFTEGKDGAAINVDVLKGLVGAVVTDADEKYGLNWHGKRRARQQALTPSTGTLRPCPEESVDWDTTQNLMIEGDNLEVLKLLQKSYANKVRVIYIDPPYNTGSDFVYPDNFQDNIKNYQELTGQIEGGKKITSNSEASGRFHTDWLNMIYPRLKLARSLLRPDGCIFISLDGHEIDNLRLACNEVFGEENLVCSFVWEKRYSPPPDTKNVGYVHEEIVFYRMSDQYKMGILPFTDDQVARYKNPDNDPRGPWKAMDYTCRYTADERPNLYYPITHPTTGEEVWPKKTRVWASSQEVTRKNEEEKRIWWGVDGTGTTPSLKNFLSEVQQGMMPMTLLHHEAVGSTDVATKELRTLLPTIKYTPKPLRLIQHLLTISNAKDDDLVMDFFAGSGTTAHAVMLMNTISGSQLRFILVQLPEPLDPANSDQRAAATLCDEIGARRTLAELTKERLRRAANTVRADHPLFAGDAGFRVFKLDQSNIRAWNPRPDDLERSLLDHLDHVDKGRSETDVLYELLLKLGLDLCVPIEHQTIAGKAVHSVGGGVLMACLDTSITAADAEPLAMGIVAWHQQQAPAGDTICVFRDSAFGDDVAKSNLAAILEQHGIARVRSL